MGKSPRQRSYNWLVSSYRRTFVDITLVLRYVQLLFWSLLYRWGFLFYSSSFKAERYIQKHNFAVWHLFSGLYQSCKPQYNCRTISLRLDHGYFISSNLRLLIENFFNRKVLIHRSSILQSIELLVRECCDWLLYIKEPIRNLLQIIFNDLGRRNQSIENSLN